MFPGERNTSKYNNNYVQLRVPSQEKLWCNIVLLQSEHIHHSCSVYKHKLHFPESSAK